MSKAIKGLSGTAQEVTKALRDFIDGSGQQWDWDNFISVRLHDDRLDDIRLRAANVPLPLDDKGFSVLRALLIEVNED